MMDKDDLCRCGHFRIVHPEFMPLQPGQVRLPYAARTDLDGCTGFTLAKTRQQLVDEYFARQHPPLKPAYDVDATLTALDVEITRRKFGLA